MICLVAGNVLAPLTWKRLFFDGTNHTVALLDNKNRTAFTDRFAERTLTHVQLARDLGMAS